MSRERSAEEVLQDTKLMMDIIYKRMQDGGFRYGVAYFSLDPSEEILAAKAMRKEDWLMAVEKLKQDGGD